MPFSNGPGNYCWSQRATNESMLGAMGPLNFQSLNGSLNYQALDAIGAVNTVLVLSSSGSLQWPVAADPSGAEVIDEASFLGETSLHMNLDVAQLELSLYQFAGASPSGTDASFLIAPKGLTGELGFQEIPQGVPLSLLTVQPGGRLYTGVSPVPPELSATAPSPVGYVDSYPASAASPTDAFVPEMFWRAHLDGVCSDVQAVVNLQSECAAAAPLGGNPEACTACADLAELFVPTCLYGTLGPSRCSAIGAPGSSAPPQLPSFWFDGAAREFAAVESDSDINACGIDPYYLAVEYCTGAVVGVSGFGNGGPGSGEYFSSTGPATLAGTSPCPDPEFPEFDVPERHVLISGEIGDNSVPTPPAIVNAVDQTEQFRSADVNGSCIYYERWASDDGVGAKAVAPLPVFNSEATGDRALVNWGPVDLSFCGVTQVNAMFNRACSEVSDLTGGLNVNGGLTGVEDGGTNGELYEDPDSGASAQTRVNSSLDLGETITEYRCDVKEPRTFVPTCPAGFCNSSGVCIPAKVPPGGGVAATKGPGVTIWP